MIKKLLASLAFISTAMAVGIGVSALKAQVLPGLPNQYVCVAEECFCTAFPCPEDSNDCCDNDNFEPE